MIKVAHITTIDLSLRYLLLAQLQSLQAAGYDPCGISAPGPDTAVLEAAGIRHIPVSMTRNFSPFADLVSLWRLYRVMRRERFAIVHTHTPKPGLLGQLAARLAGVPVIVNTLHGFYFHERMHPAARRFYITLEKIAAACSDRILSQNREDMQTAIRERICAPEKIRHLGNGIDLAAFDPARFTEPERVERRAALGLPAAAPVVGFVGRLAARRKGFLDVMEAGRRMAAQRGDVHFLVVGEADPGKSDAVSPAIAADYGIAAACRFLGRRPNEELPGLYALMDVLVLPSLFEGVPRVVMEASAMGVPVVASDVKGNREAVVPGVTGLLVPYGDAAGLAGAILDVLGDRARARRMGQAGCALARERFDELRVFDTVRAEYARLLGDKGLDAPRQSARQRRET